MDVCKAFLSSKRSLHMDADNGCILGGCGLRPRSRWLLLLLLLLRACAVLRPSLRAGLTESISPRHERLPVWNDGNRRSR